jgi:hypothetical protein
MATWSRLSWVKGGIISGETVEHAFDGDEGKKAKKGMM